MFHDSFANIVMITFTALIMIEILNVYTQVSEIFIIHDKYALDSSIYIQNVTNAACKCNGLFYFNYFAKIIFRFAVY
jgi:hypothetical protein